jgi:hypothetical protein
MSFLETESSLFSLFPEGQEFNSCPSGNKEKSIFNLPQKGLSHKK